jgi:hypothetical protein
LAATNKKVFQLRYQHPDDVELTDANGNNALHLAAEKGL